MRPPFALPPSDPRSRLRDRRLRGAWQSTPARLDPVTGWLVADGQAALTWTGLPATWAAWTTWNYLPKSPIAYDKLIDVGAVVSFVPLVSVTGDGQPTIEEQHSSDGVTFTAYAAAGPQVTARYIRIRVHMAGSYPKMKSMRIILSANPITEIIQDLATVGLAGAYRIGVGDVRLPITKAYAIIKKVDITLQSVGAGWSVELIDKDKAVGPRIKIYNAANALADAVIDATVTGI